MTWLEKWIWYPTDDDHTCEDWLNLEEQNINYYSALSNKDYDMVKSRFLAILKKIIFIVSVVGAVGEMASMKRHKLWKTGEDGLCCSSSAIQTRLGPSSLLEKRSEIPIVFVVSLCCWLPPKLGETAKVYRIELCIMRLATFPLQSVLKIPQKVYGKIAISREFC